MISSFSLVARPFGRFVAASLMNVIGKQIYRTSILAREANILNIHTSSAYKNK